MKKRKSFVPLGLKGFVQQEVTAARKALCLNDWSIQVCYQKDEKKSERTNDVNAKNVAGEASVVRRYLQLTIYLYPTTYRMWGNGDKDAVRDTIFHEVAHTWTEHMKDLMWSSFKDEGECHDAWEALTQRIANLAIGYTSKK